VAKRCGLSIGSIRSWSLRFGWTQRVRDYNMQLFRMRFAVDVKAHTDNANLWAERGASFKELEWQASQKLLEAARNHLDYLLATEPGKATLAEIARALEIASKLGRLATGLATDKQEHTGAADGPIRLELTAALNKIYGPPSPGEILDVETVAEKAEISKAES
jgi:hypothetical protein